MLSGKINELDGRAHFHAAVELADTDTIKCLGSVLVKTKLICDVPN